MSTLKDLRKLVSPGQPSKVGRVVEVGESSIRVRTQQGVKDLPAVTPSAYKVNDLVRYQGDVLVGKIASDIAIPTFSV